MMGLGGISASGDVVSYGVTFLVGSSLGSYFSSFFHDDVRVSFTVFLLVSLSPSILLVRIYYKIF